MMQVFLTLVMYKHRTRLKDQPSLYHIHRFSILTFQHDPRVIFRETYNGISVTFDTLKEKKRGELWEFIKNFV